MTTTARGHRERGRRRDNDLRTLTRTGIRAPTGTTDSSTHFAPPEVPKTRLIPTVPAGIMGEAR